MYFEFEYDENKSRQNSVRHGISLEDAIQLWRQSHVVIPAKKVDGELRWALIGMIGATYYVAIYTERGDRIRIISCHRADRKLERIYERKTNEKTD